jgi:hypothetical protein
MKTPEELATDWIIENRVELLSNPCHSAFLAGYQHARGQLAATDKVICNTTMEEIQALDSCDHIVDLSKMVDVNYSQWISVEERLPKDGQEVLVFEEGTISTNCFSNRREPFLQWDLYQNGFSCHPSHWMPLPQPPKEEK